eukprot:GHVO01011035.1.p1 GENE.GHVO01011035.1~~GHVO01011035.1.p1  ORF type:complete len:211 (+),score=36.81 GHVO01011035.1:22-654(+)
MFNLFGIRKKEPSSTNTKRDQMRRWKRTLAAEMRGIDREVQSLSIETAKVRQEISRSVDRDDSASAQLLAKEVASAERHRKGLLKNKAHINSICMAVDHAIANMRLSSKIAETNVAMKNVRKALHISNPSESVLSVQREMDKLGFQDECTFAEENSDSDKEDVDAQVEKILEECQSCKPNADHLRILRELDEMSPENRNETLSDSLIMQI